MIVEDRKNIFSSANFQLREEKCDEDEYKKYKSLGDWNGNYPNEEDDWSRR
jgi:hypothetical protein